MVPSAMCGTFCVRGCMAERVSVVWTPWAIRDVLAAAFYGRAHEVMAALDAGFPPGAVCDTDGETLLHNCFAANTAGMRDVMQRLLAAGCDPNARDNDGVTPVHVACNVGNLQNVQELVAIGGSLCALDNDYDDPPLFYALGGCGQAEERCRLLQWLADRPEVDWCHRNREGLTAFDCAFSHQHYFAGESHERCLPIVAAAMKAQRERAARWSPLRAAFVGTVAVSAAATAPLVPPIAKMCAT